ncbi:hypothetical protein F5883DRAFT_569025 [Diaporthe sp. PMI_573]|nr:hypothetical protein F5883DRAFT_569025 [Diaporthaceae sp. PMI_573]
MTPPPSTVPCLAVVWSKASERASERACMGRRRRGVRLSRFERFFVLDRGELGWNQSGSRAPELNGLIWSWFESGQVQVRLGNWVWVWCWWCGFLVDGCGWVDTLGACPSLSILDLVARICRDTRDSWWSFSACVCDHRCVMGWGVYPMAVFCVGSWPPGLVMASWSSRLSQAVVSSRPVG